MERTFEHEIKQIRDDLLLMGGKVEEMISIANTALVERDNEIIRRGIDMDDEVDQLEKQVDQRCSATLVRHQPMARDLRFLVASLKITKDLERMGDCAVNILKSVRKVNKEPPLGSYVDLPRMAVLAGGMVRDSLDAFVRWDSQLARQLALRDEEVDKLYKRLFRALQKSMIDAPQNVRRSLHLLLVARNYERIADHAQNVGEDVVYFVEGEDVRHLDL